MHVLEFLVWSGGVFEMVAGIAALALLLLDRIPRRRPRSRRVTERSEARRRARTK